MQEQIPDWPATIYSYRQASASVWLRLSLSWIVMRHRTDRWFRNVGKQLRTYSAQYFRRAKDYSFIIFATSKPWTALQSAPLGACALRILVETRSTWGPAAGTTWSDKVRELIAVNMLHNSLLNTTVFAFKVLRLGSYALMPAPSPPFKTILELVLWNGLQSCRCISPDVIMSSKCLPSNISPIFGNRKIRWGLDPVNRQGVPTQLFV